MVYLNLTNKFKHKIYIIDDCAQAHGSYDDLKRKILQIAYNKKELTYLECKYQFVLEVLEDKLYLNDNILGKFYDRDFK